MKYLYLPLLFTLLIFNSYAQVPECTSETNIPFSVNQNSLTIWIGHDYAPAFLNGVNLGVSVPGTFPGELAASRQQYWSWFEQIKETGFNNIRIYTLHYPRFYQVLDSFNLQHQQNPLYVFHGIWLDESLEGYDRDLYFLTDTFDLQIEEVIDCIHGNKLIEPRFGKAFGNYNTDASKWIFAYIIGRETHPDEVMNTNELHADQTSFIGDAFSLMEGSPSETWITARLNHLVVHERSSYQTERPVSYSSWPTLDPIDHPTETGWEDTVSIDLSNIDFHLAPAGIFASFHAYPYYPDFISTDPVYQTYYDDLGQNSYLGYLTDLKAHYNRYPLIIAEFGIPSSWGIAHYAQSGMHHGGVDELQQGIDIVRMMHNISEAGCGGGMYFSWIDEWFKRTWITDPIDFDSERRKLWHNVTAAEQNFGLVKFESEQANFQLLSTFADTCPVSELYAKTDYAFVHLKLNLRDELNNTDTLWIAIDTYDKDLGESTLPTGDVIENRAEFLLKITHYSAELYVTEAYDLFGIWHGVSEPEQLYHSIVSVGKPWKIVRWKNNQANHEIQYIGNMGIRRDDLPSSSLDAVVIATNSIEINLPWSLLQFTDPSRLEVMNDDRSIPGTQVAVSDGIAFSILHQNCMMTTTDRLLWSGWETIENVVETDKQSLLYVKNNFGDFNTPAIAVCDEYIIDHNNGVFTNSGNGVLANDFDLDGNYMEVEVTEYPSHGSLFMDLDGSFSYEVDGGFTGIDYFRYQVYDGHSHSLPSFALIDVDNTGIETDLTMAGVQLYPNPATNRVHVVTRNMQDGGTLTILNANGQQFYKRHISEGATEIDISSLNAGYYLVFIDTEDVRVIRKLVIL